MTTRTKGGSIHRLLVFAVLASTVGLTLAGSAAAAAPSAITGPVTSVGPTTATATGTVNPGGQATTWYVEYGTSTSYGTKTANVSAGSGTANTAVSASLTGLTAGTTYHYRVVATNSAGTDQGADGIFTTSAGPVAVTGSATSVTTTTATLNGTVDPNGRATDVVLRVRDEHELRLEDGREKRRLGYEHGGRLGCGVGPDAWPALPLSPRCDQRRRNEPRRGPDPLDDHGAHSGHRGRELDRPDVGEAQRPSHTEWASHELVLRVRHGHELRHQDADEEPRRRHERRQRRRIAHGPEKDHHLPLSPGRDERLRHDFWRRPDLQHVACACCKHRCRPERRSDDGDADGRGRPERQGDELVLRVRDVDAVRVADADEEPSRRAPGREASAHRSRVSRQGRPTTTGSSRRAMQGPVEEPTRRSRQLASRSPLLRAWSSTDAASRCRDPSPSSAPARP